MTPDSFLTGKTASIGRSDPQPAAYTELLRRFGEISDLGRARALLAWDERTMMPRNGAAGRAEQIATLARVRHERLTDDRLWSLLEQLEGADVGLKPGSIEADTVRIARRECDRARRVPAELRSEMARAASHGEAAWAEAREAGELDGFLPCLERNVELARRYAACLAEGGHPYDPLLDDFEPELPTELARSLLGRLRSGLVPLVEAIGEREPLDPGPLQGRFDVDSQRRLVADTLALLPLPAGGWRLDPTVHPFATSISAGDIRLTTRYEPEDLSYALFSALHEAGHGIYEAGIPAGWRRTPIGHPASLAFHESQSRMWENWVGRSASFLERLLPLLRSHFPGRFEAVDAAALHRAANRVEPSPIRVEADEVTYNLHIGLRFELELELFEGSLEVAGLAEAWRERTREYLGIGVESDREGLLQDVHWAAGSFGYFPTYALGNIAAAQLWTTAATELGDLDALIAAGELARLRDWLAERLHRHGARFLPAELAERALGGPLDPAPLLAHLEAKYGALYAL